MSWRFIRLSLAVVAGLMVASCSSSTNFIADNLPPWAGGLPPGTPPRQGAPGYDAYMKSIGLEAPANAVQPPAQPEAQPPRKSRETVDEPIH
jgi:hypothetical protein